MLPDALPSLLVLSLFPGVDLLGRGFEAEGFCVVRGPDKILAGDVADFRPVPGRFDGVIGGSPCQDFSKARRLPATGSGILLVGHFMRVVREAQPSWFLLENVPGVPEVGAEGFTVQRLEVRACEFGLPQKRIRHVQFGWRGLRPRLVIHGRDRRQVTEPAALAREGGQTDARAWPHFCAAQGSPPLALPDFTKAGRYKLVGNAVPLPLARALAAAVRRWLTDAPSSTGHGWDLLPDLGRGCSCGCGRPIFGRQIFASPACRKREQRRRDVAASASPLNA